MIPVNVLASNQECDFAKFFKQLGYRYSWDFSKKDGLHWHELYLNDKLVFQCEMDIPLERIINDMCVEEDFRVDYFIAGNHTLYPRLCEEVRNFTGKRWKTLKDRLHDLNRYI